MTRVPIGVFDHLDRRPDVPLAQTYEDRLKLIEAYDRAGFYAFHMAEHHATPLTMAPAPSVFLSLVAQRTRQIRLGPMVYVLPLYHPLRLLEEICMLDQLSGGRFELGIGRGVSRIELGYFGISEAEARERYDETLAALIAGFQTDELTFHGKHYEIDAVPINLHPVQRPHPPLWVGIGTVEGAERAGRLGQNALTNSPLAFSTDLMRRYTDAYADAHGGDVSSLPKMALCRHLYVAETDAEAERIMRGAYKAWWDHFIALWRRHGAEVVVAQYEEDFDASKAKDLFVYGSPSTVAAEIERYLETSGTNYFVGRFAYGSLTYEQSRAALDLFVEEVMPKVGLAAGAAVGGGQG